MFIESERCDLHKLNKHCNFICGLHVMVACNQPISNVTKINQLIYMCNQSDIYMIKSIICSTLLQCD
jgi:hypothetical protein